MKICLRSVKTSEKVRRRLILTTHFRIGLLPDSFEGGSNFAAPYVGLGRFQRLDEKSISKANPDATEFC